MSEDDVDASDALNLAETKTTMITTSTASISSITDARPAERNVDPAYLPFSIWMLLHHDRTASASMTSESPYWPHHRTPVSTTTTHSSTTSTISTTTEPPVPLPTVYITQYLVHTVQLPGDPAPPPEIIEYYNENTVYVIVTVGPPVATPTPTIAPPQHPDPCKNTRTFEIVCTSNTTFNLCANQVPMYANPKSCSYGSVCCPTLNSCVPAASCAGYWTPKNTTDSACRNVTDGTLICTSDTTFNTCWNEKVLTVPDPACSTGGKCCPLTGKCDYSDSPYACLNITRHTFQTLNFTGGGERLRVGGGGEDATRGLFVMLVVVIGALVALF